MAVYRFNARIISRSQGHQAVASAAYRSGEKFYDEKYDKTHDYTKKSDVIHSEILLPENAPEWMKDREKLWNAVESKENRKDSQLAREVVIALQRELTLKQNIDITKEFIQTYFVSKGMIADISIHNPKAKDGLAQPHAHVMLTMREIKNGEFGLKERSWNEKIELILWRDEWANIANKYLALNGIDITINSKSYAELGINLEPQNKIGKAQNFDSQERIEEHKKIARNNGERIYKNPKIALDALTRQHATFTHHDLARFINRHTETEAQFKEVFEKVKLSNEIVFLGIDEDRKERFTSQKMLDTEFNLLAKSKEIFNKNTHAVKEELNKVINSFQLSEEQTKAFNYLVAEGGLKNVVGYAGTGKSRLLGAARECWEKSGYRVYGATLSGIAAENLEASSGINSRTLASRLYAWKEGRELLTSKDILVLDEGGMIGTYQMAEVINAVHKSRAKLIIVGDYKDQIQAIDAGAPFRGVVESTKSVVELKEIWRQKEEWQREASVLLANNKIVEALDLYEKRNLVYEFSNLNDAKVALINTWNDTRIANPDKTQIMLSFRRADVHDLNVLAREERLKTQELGEDFSFITNRGERKFAEGEIIYFLKNDRELGVKNGTLGTIVELDKENLKVKIFKENKEEQIVSFSINQYKDLDYGYASTIHKGQGGTFDRTFFLASKYIDRHIGYVGLTRHRESVEIFWSKDEFANKDKFIKALSIDASKDLAIDYWKEDVSKANFATNRGFSGLWEGFWENHGYSWAQKITDVFSRLFEKYKIQGNPMEYTGELKKIKNEIVAVEKFVDSPKKSSKNINVSFVKENNSQNNINISAKNMYFSINEGRSQVIQQKSVALNSAFQRKMSHSDFNEFKRDFEQKNPELAKKLNDEFNSRYVSQQEIEKESQINRQETTKEGTSIKQKELDEMER